MAATTNGYATSATKRPKNVVARSLFNASAPPFLRRELYVVRTRLCLADAKQPFATCALVSLSVHHGANEGRW
jgi:hypothetical protein